MDIWDGCFVYMEIVYQIIIAIVGVGGITVSMMIADREIGVGCG